MKSKVPLIAVAALLVAASLLFGARVSGWWDIALLAAAPSAAPSGFARLFFTSTGPSWIDASGTVRQVGGGSSFSAPWSGFTELAHSGSYSASTVENATQITMDPAASVSFVSSTAITAGSYSVAAGIEHTTSLESYEGTSLIIRDGNCASPSANGAVYFSIGGVASGGLKKISTFLVYCNGSYAASRGTSRWISSDSKFSLRIRESGGTRYFEFAPGSAAAGPWAVFDSEATGTFIAPTQAGISTGAGAAIGGALHLTQWKQ